MPMTDSRRTGSFWPSFVFLLASLAIYILSILAADGFTIDDAYISARYAKNLATSGELTWNVGELPRTEGYTSPLWVGLSSVLFMVTEGTGFRLIQLMGIPFGLLTLFMLFVLARRLYGSRWCHALPTLFLSMTGPFVLWSISGMESPLYIFLVLLGLYLVIREEENGLSYLTPLILFLVFLTRTEGLVFYGSVVAIRFIRLLLRTGPGRIDTRKFIKWNGVFLLCLCVYVVWKISYYQALLPLPVHVKKPADFAGLKYVASLPLYVAPFTLLALLGLRGSWESGKVFLWGALGAYLLAISVSNPLMGYDYRLLVAAFPMVYLLAAWELDAIFSAGHVKSALSAVFILIVLFLSLSIIKGPSEYAHMLRDRARASAQVLETVHVPLGRWLEQRRDKTGTTSVALADAGAIAFYFSGRIIDLYGLNDRAIAYNGFSAEGVLQREPDYVILNSRNRTRFAGNNTPCGKMSEDIFRSGLFQKHYSFVKQFTSDQPFYSLWVYERTGNGSLNRQKRDSRRAQRHK